MADFTITGYTTVARTLTGGEYGILTDPDAVLVVSDGHAVTVNNSLSSSSNRLIVNGTIATTSSFQAVGHDGSVLYVTVGKEGQLQSAAGTTLISSVSGAFVLDNAGTIQSVNSWGVLAGHSDASALTRVVNSGRISGDAEGIRLVAGNGSAALINSGTVTGYLAALLRASDGANTVVLRNSGAIDGNAEGLRLYAGTGGVSFVNTGTISGNTAVLAFSDPGATYLYLNNAGTIAGAQHGLRLDSYEGPTTITNGGLISGWSVLSAGADRYEGGSGRHEGLVQGNTGDDSLSGGAFTDIFSGQTGNDLLVGRGGDDSLNGGSDEDVLIGGDGNDSMDGGTEDDTLIGNSGDDTMMGGDGADVMVGQDGADSMDGGSGNDTMDGGAGNDVMEGGDGVDVLRGRDGVDELAGGLGLDFLTGGRGADTFVFRTTAQAGLGALRDQILDFEQGLDVINVVSMSPAVFSFVGTGPFTAPNQIRVIETASGSSIVQFNTDADLAPEAEIRVANVTGLTADDFAL